MGGAVPLKKSSSRATIGCGGGAPGTGGHVIGRRRAAADDPTIGSHQIRSSGTFSCLAAERIRTAEVRTTHARKPSRERRARTDGDINSLSTPHRVIQTSEPSVVVVAAVWDSVHVPCSADRATVALSRRYSHL